LRKHSLFISGVNNELSADEVVKFLKSMFPLLAGSCGVSSKHIEPPLVVQMVRDLEPLMVLKQKIEKNGFKNEYYKQRFE
jgi:transcription initiation factor IIF auxiliary subunit